MKCVEEVFLLEGDTISGRVDPLPSEDNEAEGILLLVLQNIFQLVCHLLRSGFANGWSHDLHKKNIGQSVDSLVPR